MSMKCQYKPVTSICTAPPSGKPVSMRQIGHQPTKTMPMIRWIGMQAGHEEIKNKKHLHLAADSSPSWLDAGPVVLREPESSIPESTARDSRRSLFGLDSEEYGAEHHRRDQPVPDQCRSRPQLGSTNGQGHGQAAREQDDGIDASEQDVQSSRLARATSSVSGRCGRRRRP